MPKQRVAEDWRYEQVRRQPRIGPLDGWRFHAGGRVDLEEIDRTPRRATYAVVTVGFCRFIAELAADLT